MATETQAGVSPAADVIDSTAVDEPITDEHATPASLPPASNDERALIIREGSTAIINAPTAGEKVSIATEIANALSEVIKKQGLRTKVGRHKVVRADGTEVWEDKYHVDVEGWQTLATFLDTVPLVAWSRKVIDPATGRPVKTEYEVERYVYAKVNGKRPTKAQIKSGAAEVEAVEKAIVSGYDWEAKVVAVRNGVVVGEAESMCSRSEESWRDSDEFAVRSMAQTRATSRAIAAAARWIVTLAGFSGTPAEEMTQQMAAQPAEPADNGNPTREFGPPLPEEDREKLMRATAFLLQIPGDGPNMKAALELLNVLDGKFGYMPDVAARTLGIAAARIRELDPTLDVVDFSSAADEAAPAGEEEVPF